MPRIQEIKSCALSVGLLGSAYVMSPQAKKLPLTACKLFKDKRDEEVAAQGCQVGQAKLRQRI